METEEHLRKRFLSFVLISEEGCWEWQGAKHRRNYGGFSINGSMYRANRVAWALAYGTSTIGLSVCHTCDNPSCVRPTHLFLGTHQDNMNDAITKGRIKIRVRTTKPTKPPMPQPTPNMRLEIHALEDFIAKYG